MSPKKEGLDPIGMEPKFAKHRLRWGKKSTRVKIVPIISAPIDTEPDDSAGQEHTNVDIASLEEFLNTSGTTYHFGSSYKKTRKP